MATNIEQELDALEQVLDDLAAFRAQVEAERRAERQNGGNGNGTGDGNTGGNGTGNGAGNGGNGSNQRAGGNAAQNPWPIIIGGGITAGLLIWTTMPHDNGN